MNYHLSLLLLLCWNLEASAAEIKIGVLSYPPEVVVTEVAEGKYHFSGPTIDLIRKITTATDHKVRFVVLPFRRAYSELEHNRIDLLFPVTDPAAEVIVFASPLFKTTPGLCFKRNNFIPVLSAIDRLEGLQVAYPAGASIEPLLNSAASLVKLYGNNMYSRAVNMVIKGRVDAMYHESPQRIYRPDHYSYKSMACSYFQGYTSNAYLAVSRNFSWRQALLFNQLQSQLTKSLSERKMARYRKVRGL